MKMKTTLLACATATAFALISSSVVWAADAPAAKTATYKVPKTAFGDPDLQGIWTNASITTLERQPGLPNRVAMTPAEAIVAEKMAKSWLAANDQPASTAAGAPKSADDPGGYNSFWIDLGSHFGKVNGEYRTAWIVDPPSGKVPYSAKALRDLRAVFGAEDHRFDGPEVRSLGERCIVGYGSTGGPPMLNVLYNNNYQIVQAPGYVTILVEMNHDTRIIRLNNKHLPQGFNPWMGDSIGHWEGDALVVETTNLNPGQQFTADIRHRLYLAPKSKVTERFSRISTGEILYSFSVEEPQAYTQTWRGEIPMLATKGPIYEYACHEGNYAMPGILAGARAEERAKLTPQAGGGK